MFSLAMTGPSHPDRRSERLEAQSVGCAMSAEPASVPVLRRFCRALTRHWQLTEDVVDAAALVVTELVTNAVLHSGSGDVVLQLTLGDGRLSVQVQDFGRWHLPTPPADEIACSGRGLGLVRALAAACSVTATDGGTRVRVELAVPGRPAPRPLGLVPIASPIGHRNL